jgi:hypothetical protein
LNLTLRNRGLVSNIFGVKGLLAQLNLKHGNDPSELKMVKTFLEGLIFVKDCDVGDLVDLVESGDAVLDKLGKLNCRLNSVRDTLNDD